MTISAPLDQNQGLFQKIVFVAMFISFVSNFDHLLLFTVIDPSLKELGFYSSSDVISHTTPLINAQLFGLFAGGFIWGIFGDKTSRRKSIILGSLIYAIPNFLNAFVSHYPLYVLFRFIAGVGMAGQMGASITLISESLPVRLRGYGTVLVTGTGMIGIIVASILPRYVDWRTMYLIGGMLGLSLLLFKNDIKDSQVFLKLNETNSIRGNLFFFFKDKERLFRFMRCVSWGLPTWFVLAIIMTFGHIIGNELGLTVDKNYLIIIGMIGSTIGDFLSGALSQFYKTRKKIIYGCLFLSTCLLYLCLYQSHNVNMFYIWVGLLSCVANFWAIMMTATAEQFGTNVRSLATILVPNFIRGAAILITFSFEKLTLLYPATLSALAVGLVTFALALFATYKMRESAMNEIDFIEHK